MHSASTAASSRASTSRTASASGRADATATASLSYCPIRTCCWCCLRRVSWRWSGRPPTSSRRSRDSRHSKARPGTTRCLSAMSCWFATARRWPRSGCPWRAADGGRLRGDRGGKRKTPNYALHLTGAAPQSSRAPSHRRSSMIIALASPCIASALDEGLDKIKRLLSEASAQGAEIVCFPEAYLPGLRGQDFEVLPFDQTEQERALKAVAQWARTYAVATILGMERLTEAGRQIAAFVIDAQG